MLRRALASVVGSPAGREILSSSSSAAASGYEVITHAKHAVAALALTAVPRGGGFAQQSRALLAFSTSDRGFAAHARQSWMGSSSGSGNVGAGSSGRGLTARSGGGVAAGLGTSPMSCLRASFASASGAGLKPAPGKATSVLNRKPERKPFFNRSGQESAIVHVSSLMNNTFVTLTTLDGDTLAWASGGTQGFKGSRRATAHAAQLCGEAIGKQCVSRRLLTVSVRVKGPGYGKESSLRGLKNAGVRVVKIQDVSSTPHNGCRPKKRRRI